MTGHLRVKSPWTQLAIFLGLFGLAFFIISLMMTVIVLLMGVPITEMGKVDLSRPDFLPKMKAIQAVSSIIIFLLPAIIFGMICFRGRPLYFLGLKRTNNYKYYLLAVVGILIAFPFVNWLGEINQMIPLPAWMTGLEKDANKQLEAFLKAGSFSDVVINVFIIALLPAICEEICFRGALQRILIHISKNPWVGIIFTAILFSALHLQFQGFLPRMFLGILLGAIYWYSGSLWPSIVAHFIYNGVQVVWVSYIPEDLNKNVSFSIFLALMSGILVWAILWMFKSISTSSYAKVYEPEQLNSTNQFLA